MNGAKIQINEVRLRCSGITAEQAKQLTHLVLKRLERHQFKTQLSRTVPSATVRVNAKSQTSLDGLADQIASKLKVILS